MLESEVDRYKVIDTDTHVIEPYDLWTSRLDVKKWGDKVPHVRFDEKFNEDAWYFGEKRIGAAAGAAQAGWNQYPPKLLERSCETSGVMQRAYCNRHIERLALEWAREDAALDGATRQTCPIQAARL